MNKNIQHHLSNVVKLLIGWPLSFIALFFISKLLLTRWTEAAASLHAIRTPELIAAFACFFFYFFFRGYFWHYLLKLEGIRISLKETLFFWGFSELRRYIPGNIWSVVSRTSYFAKNTSKRAILKLQVHEQLYLIMSGFLISLFAVGFLFFGVFHFLPFPHLFSLVTIAIVVLALILFLSFPTWQHVLGNKAHKMLVHLFPNFSIEENAKLLLIMFCSWIFFGVGTYLAIDSFAGLYLPHLMSLVGFFVFSFLAGYLSFVTPMGLGVREGIMGIGVARYLNSLSLGVAAALIARLALVIGELIFIVFSFIWYKANIPVTEKMWHYVVKHKYAVILSIAVCCYILYFTFASFLRYTNFYTGRFDLGNMDQTVWNTLHGHVFQLTDPDGTAVVSRLAFHADFVLILLAPFYLLWQDPRMLLLLQTIILASGAVFLYFLGKHITQNRFISLMISLCYLLNPSVEYSNLYDFHAVTFATSLFIASWYFLVKKKYFWFGLFAVLAALTKEEIWIIVGFLGIFLLVKEKKWIWGSAMLVASIAIFYYLVSVAIPSARGKEHFALSYYADFGSSPSGILKTIIFSPQKTLTTILQPKQLGFIGELFLPLAFIPFLSPLVLAFMLPELGINLLSKNTQLHQIYFQYTAAITPFLFIATFYGVNWLKKKRISYEKAGYTILACTLMSVYFFGPLVGSMNPNIDMFVRPLADRVVIASFLQNIPPQFSVAATNNLGSHLSHREKIFTIPTGINEADILVFLLNDQFAQPSLAVQKKMVNDLKHNKNYIEVFKLHDFVVFEKRNVYLQKEPNVANKTLYPLSIPAMQKRDFVGGEVTTERTLETTPTGTTYLVSYPSDGLRVYAALSIPARSLSPNGFPVVILHRGFTPNNNFIVENSYKNITDYFVSKGFIVLRPEYRGNGESEKDTSLPKTPSYPIDVLNLLSSIPSLPQANANEIFLWGHSFGAGTVLSVLAAHDTNTDIDTPIRAAALWSPIIDPYRGYIRLRSLYPSLGLPYQGLVKDLGGMKENPFFWQSISPLYYLNDITTPIQISHGLADKVIPYGWSIELFDDLKSYNKIAQLNLYQNGDHTLSAVTKKALDKDIAFFRTFMH